MASWSSQPSADAGLGAGHHRRRCRSARSRCRPRPSTSSAYAATEAWSARSSAPTSTPSMPASASRATSGRRAGASTCGAGAGQRPHHLDADAGVAAGDQREPAGQVDAVEHLGRGGVGAEPGAERRLRVRHDGTGGKLTSRVTASHSSMEALSCGQLVARRLEHVVPEQQPQRRVLEAGHHQHRLGHLARVAGQVVGELLDQVLAHAHVVGVVVDRGRRLVHRARRPVGAEAAGLDRRHLDAQRPDLLRRAPR